jgi:hypothetical protein
MCEAQVSNVLEQECLGSGLNGAGRGNALDQGRLGSGPNGAGRGNALD